jgi:hypothetical protein
VLALDPQKSWNPKVAIDETALPVHFDKRAMRTSLSNSQFNVRTQKQLGPVTGGKIWERKSKFV